METQLVRFDIIGLYGIKDFSIKIVDNKVIIVGENGSGKTTLFKIMYYTLSCDWDSLRLFDFEYVSIFFSNNEKVSVYKELINSIFEIDNIDRIQFYYDGHISNRRRMSSYIIKSLIDTKRSIEEKNESEFDKENITRHFPYRYIRNLINSTPVSELYSITKRIERCFNSTILYLPTYRRIEEQLINIFPNMDCKEWLNARNNSYDSRSIELIEFGMDDVEKAVKDYQDHLNDFSRVQQNKMTLGYLSEIISEAYEQVDIEFIRNLTEDQISEILKRIEQNILSDDQKEEITRILSHTRDTLEPPHKVREKIICHYFLKLIDFDRDMCNEEQSLLKFVKICNKYLVNNKLLYDKDRFACSIVNKSFDNNCANALNFQNLSSGEKQIVSLFSHLNLLDKKRLFVFIDEPELSLSVEWQRMILVDILDSASCIGLVATTHSPFVFDNELENYVHGINEFSVKG